MALETGSYPSDLVASNPVGATDPKSQGDDHIRLIKTVLKTTFPNVSGAITPTHTELNYVDGVTSALQTQLDAKIGTTNSNVATTGLKTVGFNAEYDNGNSGASKTVTLTNGQKQKITLTANTTITISFTSATVGNYQLRLIQDGTGGRTVAWTGLTATRWLGAASAPAPNSAIAGESIVSIYWDGAAAVQSLVKVGAV